MLFVVKNESRIFSYDDRKTESYYSMLNEITTIEIKEGITKIGDYSMKGLSKVTEIIINKTIERIGMNVFEDCISLIVINVNSENEYLISNEGILFNKDKTELIQYPIGNSRTNYTIPEETETIRIGSSTICYKLEDILVNENNQHFISIEWVLLDYDKTKLTILSIEINSLRYYSSSTSFEKNIINKIPSDIL